MNKTIKHYNQALEIRLTLEIMTLNKNIENAREQSKPDYFITVYQALINEKEDELRLLQCVES